MSIYIYIYRICASLKVTRVEDEVAIVAEEDDDDSDDDEVLMEVCYIYRYTDIYLEMLMCICYFALFPLDCGRYAAVYDSRAATTRAYPSDSAVYAF